MIIRCESFARAGLVGNPSDGYHGKTISVELRNFTARITCYESPRLAIRPVRRDQLEFDGLDALVDDVTRNGYYGGIRLIKATIKRFSDECCDRGIQLPRRNFTMEYETDIPVRVGLAGSSAIVTSALRALMAFFEVEIPQPHLPNVILSVELDELGIAAGLQDRVIQVYGGVVFMDFDRDRVREQGHGDYEPLDPEQLPPLFVAFHDTLAEGTEVPHSDLQSRFMQGDREVVDAMKQFALFAQQSRDLIVGGRGNEIGPLMDANFDLRHRITSISEGNCQLVEIGRRHGAGVKFAGSGGAVIGCYDGDPQRLEKLRVDYEAFGAKLIVPAVTG